MTKLIGFLAIIAIFTAVTVFLPVVDELPFGMDAALTFFMSTVNGLLTLFPWMQLPWALVLWALLIKSLLFIFHWVIFFINFFASIGSAPRGR